MAAEPKTRPLLLGHRGCRQRGFHENTIGAFEHALREGCDGFEFDVRLTADGKAICVHDEAPSGNNIAFCSYSQLLNHNFKATGSRAAEAGLFPLLEVVLQAFGSRAFVDIELKVEGLEERTIELVRAMRAPRGIVISSFLPEVVVRVTDLAPEIETGFIFRDRSGVRQWRQLPVKWVIPRHDFVSKELIKAVHGEGRKLMTWTVNRRSEMRWLEELGVDGMIGDEPRELAESQKEDGTRQR